MIMYLLFSCCRQSRGSQGKKGIAKEEKAESGLISILLLLLWYSFETGHELVILPQAYFCSKSQALLAFFFFFLILLCPGLTGEWLYDLVF